MCCVCFVRALNRYTVVELCTKSCVVFGRLSNVASRWLMSLPEWGLREKRFWFQNPHRARAGGSRRFLRDLFSSAAWRSSDRESSDRNVHMSTHWSHLQPRRAHHRQLPHHPPLRWIRPARHPVLAVARPRRKLVRELRHLDTTLPSDEHMQSAILLSAPLSPSLLQPPSQPLLSPLRLPVLLCSNPIAGATWSRVLCVW